MKPVAARMDEILAGVDRRAFQTLEERQAGGVVARRDPIAERAEDMLQGAMYLEHQRCTILRPAGQPITCRGIEEHRPEAQAHLLVMAAVQLDRLI